MLNVILVVSSAILGLQDFRTRTVTLSSLIFWGVIVMVYAISCYGVAASINQFLFNTAIWCLHYLCMHIYYVVRYGKGVCLINKAIGMGDIIFLIISSFLFPVAMFPLFLISASLSGLLYVCLSYDKNIPFIATSFPVLFVMVISN